MWKSWRLAAMSALVVVLVALSFCETPAVATFTDKRDGKTYKKVTIGKQVWMAEDLNFAASGSKCYENSDKNCAKYGRLYDWSTANKACPAGWHLPTDSEWDVLMIAVGGVKDGDYYWQGAGTKLKSSKGWANNGNGTDEYGFSALPGGHGYSDGDFLNAGYYGDWWSATEGDADNAWGRGMNYGNEYVDRTWGSKTYLFSVRCAQDKQEGQK